jgi:hypothetical protein
MSIKFFFTLKKKINVCFIGTICLRYKHFSSFFRKGKYEFCYRNVEMVFLYNIKSPRKIALNMKIVGHESSNMLKISLPYIQIIKSNDQSGN